jgi:hypothetical protein
MVCWGEAAIASGCILRAINILDLYSGCSVINDPRSGKDVLVMALTARCLAEHLKELLE